MNTAEYIKKSKEVMAAFENFKLGDDEQLTGQFNIVSASLSNFMPDIPFSDHLNIYKNILLHKKLSILEQHSLDVLNFVTIENAGSDFEKHLKRGSSIVCTFHTGSYRIINLLLTRYKIPFTLVIGKHVSELEGDLFSSIFNNLKKEKEGECLRIINAESPGAGLKMLKELKQGRTLVLYIDGNSGAGANTSENENSCLVQFMEQQLFARKGIAFLAFMAKVPILTVASYRQSWNDIRIKHFEPIMPEGLDRETFAAESTQKIYNIVSPLIRAHPDQWEGWLYVHKVAKIRDDLNLDILTDNNLNPTDLLIFNSCQFGIFRVSGIPFLIRKKSYIFYEISNDLYDQLIECSYHPARRANFEDSLFYQLYSQGILLRA